MLLIDAIYIIKLKKGFKLNNKVGITFLILLIDLSRQAISRIYNLISYIGPSFSPGQTLAY